MPYEPPIGTTLTTQQLLEAAVWNLTNNVATDGEKLTIPQTMEHYSGLMQTTHHLFAHLANRYNALRPINRLPVETLTHILGMVRFEEELTLQNFPLQSPEITNPSSQWLGALTSVCAQWRRIALSNPWFWREIWVDHITIATCFISRSSPLPIQLANYESSYPWNIEDIKIAEFSALLQRNLSRVEALFVFPLAFASKRSIIADLLREPLPNVQDLAINCYYNSKAIKITSNVIAPNLRHLMLSGYTGLPLHLLHGLTYLFLVKCHHKMDVEAFLAVLKVLPALETLILQDACPTARRPLVEYQHLQPVSLPHLRSITLQLFSPENFGDNVLYLLHKLEFPDDTFIKWNDNCLLPTSSEVPRFLNRVSYLLLSSYHVHDQQLKYNMVALENNTSGVVDKLRNIRTLILEEEASDQGTHIENFANSFPLVEECHICADEARYSSLLQKIEQSSSIPFYPNFKSLHMWLHRDEWVEDIFTESLSLTEGDAVDPLERGCLTRTRFDGSEYTITLHRMEEECDKDTDLFSWEWMVAYFAGRG